MNTRLNIYPQAAVIITAVIFGFSFLFTKSALGYLDIFHLAALRFLAAALLMEILKALGVIRFKMSLSKIKGLLMVALFQPVLYFLCETEGVNLTSASESGIVISLVPISITLFAVLLLKERISAYQWTSVFISASGVILIVLGSAVTGGGKSGLGFLFLIGAVVSAGVYNILSRKVSGMFSPVETTYVMMWIGACVFNSIAAVQAYVNGTLSDYFNVLLIPDVLVSLAYLGILSSTAAFFMLNYSLSSMEASRVAVYMNLIPVVSLLAGVFIRGEKFSFIQCIGAAIVMAGLWGFNRYGGEGRKPVPESVQQIL